MHGQIVVARGLLRRRACSGLIEENEPRHGERHRETRSAVSARTIDAFTRR
jgi:hypothetical protein